MKILIIHNNVNNANNAINFNMDINIKMNEIIKHPFGMEFPIAPFLWSYDDFDSPFKTHVTKVDKNTIDNIIKKFSEKQIKINSNFYSETELLSDYDTEYYIVEQLDEINRKINSYYIGYHTWCFYAATKSNIIENNYKGFYTFKTGIYSLYGEINHSEGYPTFGTHKKNKPGGIPINGLLETRAAIIHEIDGISRFSSLNVCNFISNSDPIIFISIGKSFQQKNKNTSNKLYIDGKNNIVTLHIFGNSTEIKKYYDIN